jgi:RluA family pseudouridine synthase
MHIIFRDETLVVVDKPAGISVHNVEDPTNLLAELNRELKGAKLFPVHRLDKETSGVQILALTESRARTMATEFQNRSVKKIYQGVLRGDVKAKRGIWSEALSDKAEGRREPRGLARDRVPCETQFEVKESNRYFSLCEFVLITGRQHQIRKHAAIARHALVGDPRYGEPNYNQKMFQVYGFDRMLLHCSEVGIAGKTFSSPVPEAFRLK